MRDRTCLISNLHVRRGSFAKRTQLRGDRSHSPRRLATVEIIGTARDQCEARLRRDDVRLGHRHRALHACAAKHERLDLRPRCRPIRVRRTRSHLCKARL